ERGVQTQRAELLRAQLELLAKLDRRDAPLRRCVSTQLHSSNGDPAETARFLKAADDGSGERLVRIAHGPIADRGGEEEGEPCERAQEAGEHSAVGVRVELEE